MNYEDIFQQRGGAYDQAMRRWPRARCDEFALPLKWAVPKAGDIVIDVPAGGGYLSEYLPESCSWFGHEPCSGFVQKNNVSRQGLLPLPWQDAFADLAISLAGVHHLNEKRPFFNELHRVLKPDGRLMLADVHVDSNVAHFLDEFVGSHNSTGHVGTYLDNKTLSDLNDCGFRVIRAERAHYGWWFADRMSMVTFCRFLFDLRNINDREIANAIEKYLGLRVRGIEVGMNWDLFFVLGTRK